MEPRFRITVELLNPHTELPDVPLRATCVDHARTVWGEGGQWLNRTTPLHTVVVEGRAIAVDVGTFGRVRVAHGPAGEAHYEPRATVHS